MFPRAAAVCVLGVAYFPRAILPRAMISWVQCLLRLAGSGTDCPGKVGGRQDRWQLPDIGFEFLRVRARGRWSVDFHTLL